MELDITEFATTECPRDYQASIAEIGDGAGRATWQAALECECMFVTPGNRQEFIDHFKEYGAWPEDEMQAWPDAELNALVVQEISSWIRAYSDDPISKWDWAGYEEQAQAGAIPGCLYRGDDGRTYAYFGM